jgi:hypothetical protein
MFWVVSEQRTFRFMSITSSISLRFLSDQHQIIKLQITTVFRTETHDPRPERTQSLRRRPTAYHYRYAHSEQLSYWKAFLHVWKLHYWALGSLFLSASYRQAEGVKKSGKIFHRE